MSVLLTPAENDKRATHVPSSVQNLEMVALTAPSKSRPSHSVGVRQNFLLFAAKHCGDALVETLNTISRSYMGLLLLRDDWAGLIFMAGTFLHPQVGLFGVLSVLAAYLFGRFIGVRADVWKTASHLSNPLLVGLGLGAFLEPSWHSAMFVMTSGVLTFVVTVALANVMHLHLKLPVLTLPAVICLTMASAASLKYSRLAYSMGRAVLIDVVPGVPLEVECFLRSLGAILFVPHAAVGLFVVCLLCWRSRILLLLAVAGFTVGVAVRSALIGSYFEALLEPNNFNFILVAMVLGGIFFVPSYRSYLVAMLGVVVSTLVLDFSLSWWAPRGLSPFVLPFNVVSLLFVYALVLLGYGGVPRVVGATPEETLQLDLATRWRFSPEWRTLGLPFYGQWTVWQGFDGPWTHHGIYRQAYDFVIADDDGRTFTGNGLSLKDYSCYRRPVVAPIFGQVVSVVQHLPDNEPGQAANGRFTSGQHGNAQSWGNHVLLYDDRGFYVVLAHLASESVKVAVGARVQPGMLLAQCGNSGFSPQPHLHIQVQATAEIGGPTLPFTFVRFLDGHRYAMHGLPATGTAVEPAPFDTFLNRRLEFLLGDELTYEVYRRERRQADLHLKVRVAEDGTLYFETPQWARLYFGKRDGAFVFYRVDGHDAALSVLLRAMPQVPLCNCEGLTWSDSLPVSLWLSGVVRAAVQLGSSFVPEMERLQIEGQFVSRDRISYRSTCRWLRLMETSHVEFDDGPGPARVELGEWTLVRSAVGIGLPTCSSIGQ